MAAFKDRIRRGLPVVIVGAAALLLGRLSAGNASGPMRAAGIAR